MPSVVDFICYHSYTMLNQLWDMSNDLHTTLSESLADFLLRLLTDAFYNMYDLQANLDLKKPQFVVLN